MIKASPVSLKKLIKYLFPFSETLKDRKAAHFYSFNKLKFNLPKVLNVFHVLALFSKVVFCIKQLKFSNPCFVTFVALLV